MKQLIISLLLPIFLVTAALAQELNCNVIINDERVQTQERQIFQEMQQAIQQFLNTTKWTNDEFEEHERIKCNLLITLRKSSTVSNFAADVQIQSLRPVYGSDYETPIFNFLDPKWQYEYTPSQPLIFAENTFTTELTSLLAFYAYLLIGLDYDTFEKGGGIQFYDRARNIAQNSEQAGSGPGWTSLGDIRDRYWLSENLNSAQFEQFREALYLYHLKGLDIFATQPEVARKNILAALKLIDEVLKVAPTSVVINSFFDAKADELQQIFGQGDMQVRTEAAQLLTRLDPTNSADYRKMVR